MGVFAILVMVIAYWGINYLKSVDILSFSNVFYAYYDKSNNIEVSSPILLRGIKIGTVTDITMDGVDSKVKVELRIDKKFHIPSDSKAMISDKSLLGGKAIVMELGSSPELVKNHGELVGVIDDNMSEQIDEVKATLLNVIEKLTATLEGTEKLLNSENIENLSKTFENLNASSEKLKELLSDEEIPAILSNLQNITTEINNATPMLTASMTNLEEITASINGADLGSTITSANSTIEELNVTLKQINSKQGTIGSLVYDGQMYENLNSASANLSYLLSDLAENPKRYVHFSIFGKKDKK